MARMVVAVEGATDLGLKRTQNEDSHACWVPKDPGERERRGVLLVVADGMGGTRAGEVASRLAAETVVASFRSADGGDPLAELYRAVEAANRLVHEESQSRPDVSGMGTTCTAAVVRGSALYFAHVGDSRAYLIRDGGIRQLTTDHSLVAQLVMRHELTAEEARVDPRRNVVTRSVGVGPEVEIDAQQYAEPLQPGDTLLLCSDGLHGQVTDQELAENASSPDLEDACRQLIALANARGGPDNITVLMARVQPAEAGPESEDGEVGGVEESRAAAPGREAPGERRPSRRTALTWLIVMVFLLVVVVVAIVMLLGRLGREAEALDRVSAHPAAAERPWA
jgi:serine/threonine protein phosphatase PrpC